VRKEEVLRGDALVRGRMSN